MSDISTTPSAARETLQIKRGGFLEWEGRE